jgi:hypothetical protein
MPAADRHTVWNPRALMCCERRAAHKRPLGTFRAGQWLPVAAAGACSSLLAVDGRAEPAISCVTAAADAAPPDRTNSLLATFLRCTLRLPKPSPLSQPCAPCQGRALGPDRQRGGAGWRRARPATAPARRSHGPAGPAAAAPGRARWAGWWRRRPPGARPARRRPPPRRPAASAAARPRAPRARGARRGAAPARGHRAAALTQARLHVVRAARVAARRLRWGTELRP